MREEAQRVLDLEGEMRRRYRSLLQRKLNTMRIRAWRLSPGASALYRQGFRHHRFRGRARQAVERASHQARVAARRGGDATVVSLRSYMALFGQVPGIRPEDFPALEPWAHFWYTWVGVRF